MEEEVWKDIPGIPGYRASSLGRIQGKRGWELACCINSRGYRQIDIGMNNGIRYNVTVHRLIAITFLSIPENEKCIIDHINGNRADNRVCNLRWSNSSLNSLNSKNRITNTSGYKGVSYYKPNNTWSARVGFQGKYYRKYCKTKDEAIEWLKDTRLELGIPETYEATGELKSTQ